MRLNPTTLLRTFALVASLFALFAVASAPALRADEVDDKIKLMKDAEKAGDKGKCIAKMEELKDSGDKRVVDALKDLARSKNDDIAIAAIKKVANRKEPEFLKWLVSHIDDKELYKPKDGRPEVYKAVLEAVAVYKSKSALKPLEDVTKKFLTTLPEYATRAIRAYGTVQDLAVIDQLIEWLEMTDSHGQSQGGKNESTETRDNKVKANKAAVDALNELTGKDIGDATTWKDFWTKNRKTFTFPDPNKKEEPLDPKAKEFTDEAYNYTVKRPDSAGWYFQPKDDTVRVRIMNKDEQNLEWGRVEWLIHNTTTQAPKDLNLLADYWMNTGLPNEFSEFTDTGKPKREEQRIAGRDWIVIKAKGMGKAGRVGWGSMERRIYLTKCDYMGAPHLILCCWITCRNGMEQEQKDRLYAAAEGIVIKPTK